MRIATKLSLVAGLIAGSLTLTTVAQAHEWERDHWRWEHRHYVERPIYVRERPVYVAPAPMYFAPPAPSGLNLNFNIPLN